MKSVFEAIHSGVAVGAMGAPYLFAYIFTAPPALVGGVARVLLRLAPKEASPSVVTALGKIAFATYNGPPHLRVMGADGSGAFTVSGGSGGVDSYAWSPDGRRIAFADYGVHVMNADGSNNVKLTERNTSAVCWSPDGQRVAFITRLGPNKGVNVINANGKGLTHLGEEVAQGLAWSPDGLRIALFSGGEGYDPGWVSVVNVDGSGRVRLNARSGLGVWSPDGKKIAIISRGIDVLNVDGSGQVRLTETRASDVVWLPNGREIVFASSYPRRQQGIYAINSDGTGEIRLAKVRAANLSPSPDGTKIAFMAFAQGWATKPFDSGWWEIHVIHSNGTDWSRIRKVDSPAIPNWLPTTHR